jgi:hypothetical protein
MVLDNTSFRKERNFPNLEYGGNPKYVVVLAATQNTWGVHSSAQPRPNS